MSPFVASAKRGLVRALTTPTEEGEEPTLLTVPTCDEGTNATAQDAPKMAKPEMADESFMINVLQRRVEQQLGLANQLQQSALFVPMADLIWWRGACDCASTLHVSGRHFSKKPGT